MPWPVAEVPGGPARVVGKGEEHFVIYIYCSPSGRYLLYADQDRQLVSRVWMVDTWAERGADPILVDEGMLGIWSWN